MTSMYAFVLSLAFACNQPASQAPSAPVENAKLYIAADLFGNGHDSLIALSGNTIHWIDKEHTIDGGLSLWRAGTLGQDKEESVVVVTSRNREHPKALPKILQIKKDEVALLYIGSSASERISDIRISRDGLFVTRVGTDKVARGGWLKTDAIENQTSSIMGLQQVPLENGDVAIGRLYGDKPKEPGRLEIHRNGQPPRIIPTLRGVRSIEPADIDGDGHQDLLVADGWHYRYGAEALARLIVLMGPDFAEKRTIAHIDTAYTINRIQTEPTPDGKPAPILIEASDGHHLLRLDSISWTTSMILAGSPNNSATMARTGKQSWILTNGQEKRLGEIK